MNDEIKNEMNDEIKDEMNDEIKDEMNDEIKISEELFDLLEYNYILYYNKLCDLELIYDKKTIKNIVDYTVYRTYFGNQLHALIYLTGDLFSIPKKEYKNFYGNQSLIPDDYAVQIFNKLVYYNIDVYQENYYTQTPLQNIMCSECLTYRINNTKLKNCIKNKYIRDLDYYLTPTMS